MKTNGINTIKKRVIQMTLVALSFSAFAQKIPRTPVENNGEGVGLMSGITQSQADAAAALVRASGYSCASISNIIKHTPFSKRAGVTLTCNNFKYEYAIEDVGGKWQVTVQ